MGRDFQVNKLFTAFTPFRAEIFNFFKKTKSILFLFRVLFYILKKILACGMKKLSYKIGFLNFCKYPLYLRKEIKNYNFRQHVNFEKVKLLEVPFNTAILPKFKTLPQEIPLASIYLKLIEGKIPWNTQFEDIEDLFALHRWGWLLKLLLLYPIKDFSSWGMRHIEDWVNVFGNKKKGYIWESYSVSERIVNIILFLCICNKYLPRDFIKKISKFILEMAYFLINNLEYYGIEKTNNHLLNNARALYMSGIFLENSFLSETGKKIWIKELPIMFTEKGFLRENSSHYHFLLTRSVLEVYWFAKKTGDESFLNELTKFAKSIVKNCCYFLVENKISNTWEMPLFGDVSPDSSPDWLITLPFSSIALEILKESNEYIMSDEQLGWSSLWGKMFFPKCLFDLLDEEFGNKFSPNNEWYRLDFKNITLFWHIDSRGINNVKYHGHYDIGSFCLYFNGYPVIIDVGRYNFKEEQFLQSGKTALSHNTFLINLFESFPLSWDSKLFPISYLCDSVKTFHKEERDNFIFGFVHKGFSRIKNIENVSRRFDLNKDRLIIEDSFYGKGEHEIFVLFHFSPFLEVTKISSTECIVKPSYDIRLPKFILKTHCYNLKTDFNIWKGDKILGWYFPRYGHKVEIFTVAWKFFVEFPIKINYIFEWVK